MIMLLAMQFTLQIEDTGLLHKRNEKKLNYCQILSVSESEFG